MHTHAHTNKLASDAVCALSCAYYRNQSNVVATKPRVRICGSFGLHVCVCVWKVHIKLCIYCERWNGWMYVHLGKSFALQPCRQYRSSVSMLVYIIWYIYSIKLICLCFSFTLYCTMIPSAYKRKQTMLREMRREREKEGKQRSDDAFFLQFHVFKGNWWRFLLCAPPLQSISH